MSDDDIWQGRGFHDGWQAIRQPLYDTVGIWNGKTDKGTLPDHARLNFFHDSVGQPSGSAMRKKTFLDTNMFVPNMMAPGTEFLIQGVSVVFVPGRETIEWVDEIFDFYTESVLDLTIGSVNYLRSPCVELLPWYYADLLNAIHAGSHEGLLMHMLEERKSHSFAPANLRLVQEQNFSVTIEHPGFPKWENDPWRKCRVALNGVYYRRSE